MVPLPLIAAAVACSSTGQVCCEYSGVMMASWPRPLVSSRSPTLSGLVLSPSTKSATVFSTAAGSAPSSQLLATQSLANAANAWAKPDAWMTARSSNVTVGSKAPSRTKRPTFLGNWVA